jgi:hypothetical protein
MLVIVLVGCWVLVAVEVALGTDPQLAPFSVIFNCQPCSLPTSYCPPSLTSSVHVPCACCPTKGARLASSGL